MCPRPDESSALRIPDSYGAKIANVCNPACNSANNPLQAKMSRGSRFLLFWHHNYLVTLIASWMEGHMLQSYESRTDRQPIANSILPLCHAVREDQQQTF